MPEKNRFPAVLTYACGGIGAYDSSDTASTLLKTGQDLGHGCESLIAFDTTQITSQTNRSNPQPGDPCHPLARGAHAPCIAFPANLSGTQCASAEDVAPSMGVKNPTAIAYSTKLHNTASNQAGKLYDNYTASLDRSSPPPALLTPSQVRRLTPLECERLQGFPDHHTRIARSKDGPRYKALGNSMAVPVIRWIGNQIDFVHHWFNA